MRLAAVYFPENEKLGGFTYNFGGHYFYKIDYLNDKLTINRELNDDYVDNFYDRNNISLLSSIVGENGSGKTTFFKAVKDFKKDYFLIFEKSKNLLYVYNTNRYHYDNFFNSNNFNLFLLQFGDKNNIIIDDYKLRYSGEVKEDFKTAKISFLYYFPNSIFDLELNKIDDFVVKNHQNNLAKIKSSIFNRQVRFLSDDLFVSKIREIYKEFPSYDSITIVSAGNFMRDHKYHDIRKFGIENNLNDYDVEEYAKRKDFELSSYFTRLNEFYEKSKNINFRIFISIYYRFLYIFINNSNSSMVKIIGQLEMKIDNHFTQFKDKKYDVSFIKELFAVFSTGISFELKESKKFEDVIGSIKNFLNVINTVAGKIELKNRNIKELNTFINAYYQLLDFFEGKIVKSDSTQEMDISFLRFDSEKKLSTGEISLLNFFSSIYHQKQNKFRFNSNHEDELLIFLLDEPELGFHPQWKKRFVNSLTKLLPLFFPDKKIQIIMSTHDPLTLSDFQNSNIIYLNKMKNNSLVVESKNIPLRSFGTNVNELLANSFFLKNDLIGDFAKEKIESIILKLNYFKMVSEKAKINQTDKDWKKIFNKINFEIKLIQEKVDFILKESDIENERKENSIFKTINLIGEPVIRYKLLEMYEEIFSDNSKKIKAEKIKRLMEELDLTKEDLEL